MIEILKETPDYLVCIKPANVQVNEEPGGIVDLIRQTKEDPNLPLFVVHRLDKPVAGLMVFAKNKKMAATLSAAITDKSFIKEYLAVVEGKLEEESGRWDDLLFHDSKRNKTYVVDRSRKGVREASLQYSVIATTDTLSLVRIRLLTGRTHQIRAQFSSRKHPLAGDKRYGATVMCSNIALWSCHLEFLDECIEMEPPKTDPWIQFS